MTHPAANPTKRNRKRTTFASYSNRCDGHRQNSRQSGDCAEGSGILSKGMRLFIGIQFSSSIRQEIAFWMRSLIQRIPDPDRRLHWISDVNLHLTLKFIGETPDSELARLESALRSCAKENRSFSLRLTSLGHFGGRVIWLGADGDLSALSALAASIHQLCRAGRFTAEGGSFQPHVTLARSKKSPKTLSFSTLPKTLTSRSFGPINVETISLIQSILTPSGAAYKTLATFPLKAS